MDIVINCLGMPFDGKTIKERSLGGSETAAYYMAKNLAEIGHNVTMFTRSKESATFDNVKYVPAGEETKDNPMGRNFHFYAENTPHDILIIQRSPVGFNRQYASKINLWWLHDLAMYRNKELNTAHLWNIDGVLVVSEYHKAQVSEVYGINKEVIHVVRNGIDLQLFDGDPEPIEKTDGTKYLIYSSRPERGLEHLVAPNGIMEQLKDDNIHLIVCGYDNKVPHMQDYYDYLNDRINKLPNCSNIGALTKQQLADLMRQMDIHVYPTPAPISKDFREVSCITVMECMAAGLPMITSHTGALPETAEGGGVKLLDLNEEGLPDVSKFVQAIRDTLRKPNLRHRQLEVAPRNDWCKTAANLHNIIERMFSKKSKVSMRRHFLDFSDIPSFDRIASATDLGVEEYLDQERLKCYAFYDSGKYKQHYEAFYSHLEESGVEFGPEKLEGNLRFESVANILAKLPDGAGVLDYGCAHGHYTINLAKRFPHLSFTGIDIAESNIEKGRKWASDEGVENVTFLQGELVDGCSGGDYDCVIACEVIEHAGNYVSLITNICRQARTGGKVIISTPYGPWEKASYRKRWPWREHLHHFDRQDIKEIYGDFDDLNIIVVPSGHQKGNSVGSFVYDFTTTDEFTIRETDYSRKIAQCMPRQTVSLCMIVKDAENTLQAAIESVDEVVLEVIVGIDKGTTDGTKGVLRRLQEKYNDIAITYFEIDSPVEIGFDAARNLTIEKASCDWVMWLDSDEKVIQQENILKYLRNNEFNGYGMAQHHYAVEPLGVMKTDYPVRLFRNHKGIRFYGVVHEHPETELNKQIGRAHIIQDVDIVHNGYMTEEIRRSRFMRNINLMIRDRKKYPERTLGKYLWIRDLAQMTKYELEANRKDDDAILKRSDEANMLWRELVDAGEIRMVVDAMDYYSFLNVCCDRGINGTFKCDFEKRSDPTLRDKKEVGGRFASADDIRLIFNKILTEKTRLYDSMWY